MTTENSTSARSDIDPATGAFLSAEGGLILLRKSQQVLGCQKPGRPTMIARNRANNTCIIFQVACKQWDCPACAETNALRCVLQATHGANVLFDAGYMLEFVTLTSHEKLDEKQSYYVLPKAWNRLNRRIKRAVGNPLYFAVPEQHKDGRWHLHALVNFNLPERWWKDNARQCGMGYQVDIQTVENAGLVSWYIAKYMTKQLQNAELYKSHRHVRHSNNWPKLPEKSIDPNWEFKIIPQYRQVSDAVVQHQNDGYTVILSDESESWKIVNAG